jgi:hypothetical protein
MFEPFRRILKVEGLFEGLFGLMAFAATGESWWLFAAVIMLPDLSVVAYLAGPRIGAALYNACHTTIGPAILAAVALHLGAIMWAAVAAAWFVHIGVDRALGYGLKSTRGFKDTHMGQLGAPCSP